MRDVSTAILGRLCAAALVLALGACEPVASVPTSALPASTADAPVPEAEATLVADRDSVRLDGAVVGAIAALVRRDDGAAAPLREALSARAEAIRARSMRDPRAPAFRGAVSLELHGDHPAALLHVLLDAAAQAGFDKPWLVVASPSGARAGIRLTLPAVAATAVAGASDAAKRHDAGYANPRVEIVPDRGFVLRVHDRVVDPGPGLVLACDRTPCGDAWPLVELNRVARRLKLDHPRDRAVVVAAPPHATVQDIVGALDATRSDAVTSRGARELFADALIARIAP